MSGLSRSPCFGSETVLVVDSYDQSRRAVADLLRRCGHVVAEAHNGLEGLHVARERLPDLIIVDLWPFFSASVQMVERLHLGSTTAHIPVLVLTSDVCAEYRSRALAAGCAGYLEKPCPPELVLEEVRRLLPSSASRCGVGIGATRSA